MLYEVAYYSDFIYINVYSSKQTFCKPWCMNWLSDHNLIFYHFSVIDFIEFRRNLVPEFRSPDCPRIRIKMTFPVRNSFQKPCMPCNIPLF
jgi:hypothetical protein